MEFILTMDRYRVIALDGSPKAGKTELAKRIIVCLKAKGYHPVVIESSNSFFNLCDLYYSNKPHTPPPCKPCDPCNKMNHYTGISIYKDCFFSMPINKYLDIYYGRFGKDHCKPSPSKPNTPGSAEFILSALFSLYYQTISAAETALAIDNKAIVILDGSPFESIVWHSIYANDCKGANEHALHMIRKIRSQFPCVFEQMLYVLTHTEAMQIYDRTKFDDKACAEYRAIYCQMTDRKNDIDPGTQIQIGISYMNDLFQCTKDVVRCEHIDTLIVPGNYAEEITRNAMNITAKFPPLTNKNDGFPGN